MKTHPGLGTPTGVADIFFCKEGFYGWLEAKGSARAKKQPGQERFVEKMDEWSFARFVHPDNWEQVKAELEPML